MPSSTSAISLALSLFGIFPLPLSYFALQFRKFKDRYIRLCVFVKLKIRNYEYFMSEFSQSGICQRIARIRLEVAGPRGKSAFAKQLGLSPSTYEYYESTRVPGVCVLVRMAELANVDLRWLITGQAGEVAVEPGHPVVQRAAAMLAERPDAAAALAAFLDLLAGSMKFPQKAGPAAEGKTASPGDAEAQVDAVAEEAWIPILGRTAAGVPHFWADRGESAGVATLGELIARHAGRSARSVLPATAAGQEKLGPELVQLVTLSAPSGAGDGPVEFVAAASIKRRYGNAFAVRVDGESMRPEIRHGDVVVLSPSVAAVEGRAAVVQLAGQIGVTCKLYRRAGDVVHLVAINEQFPPQTFEAASVVWALRVLAVVRPGQD